MHLKDSQVCWFIKEKKGALFQQLEYDLAAVICSDGIRCSKATFAGKSCMAPTEDLCFHLVATWRNVFSSPSPPPPPSITPLSL